MSVKYIFVTYLWLHYNYGYKPYIGYDTGFTYDGYRIYSYNLPTTNCRDYYLFYNMFYNMLNDPVIMVKYVISI